MGTFATMFLFFYGPYHNKTLTKVYNNASESPSTTSFTRNSLMLNELRAYFQSNSPPKSPPFSIILVS